MYKIRGPKFLQSTILVLIIESKFVRSIGERHCEKFVKINCKMFRGRSFVAYKKGHCVSLKIKWKKR